MTGRLREGLPRDGLRLRVERVVPGGRGFSRTAEGLPVFIEGGLPGDLVELSLTADKKSYVEGTVRELVEPSPLRRDPPCPYATSCGGCDWMALSLETQRELKTTLLEEALVRTGRFALEALPKVAPTKGSGEALGYRSRLRLQLKNGKLGFFSAASHQLVEVERCLVAGDEVWELVLGLRKLLESGGNLGAADGLEVRVLPGAGSLSERASVILLLREGATVGRQVLLTLEGALGVPVGTNREASPKEQLFRSASGAKVYAPLGGFTQVNEAVNGEMVGRVVEFARTLGAKSFLDLYSGSGNFSLPLGLLGLRGLGIEVSASAIAAARRAVHEQGLDAVVFDVGDVAEKALRLARKGETFDLVVADPPRAGARGAVPSIFQCARKGIAMVSCDPVTLARDLKELVALGAKVVSIEPFDMFPQTSHVETVVLLEVPVRA